ncbi:hypothetical protein ACE3LZ_02985 [Staphylococcus saprophyticus]|uniref:hypothetical protein n=1 Tax=Staphylococcus saprophyticus TaxID=29385 RepID=UPI00365010A5
MRNKNFESEGGAIVYFDYDGNLTCARGFVPQDFFTVTTEVEITEDTKLDLVLRFIAGDEAYYINLKTMSINTCLEAERDDVTKTHFYIENDDRELVLIWRDGKLVK